MTKFKTLFYSLRRSLFDLKYYSDVATSTFWFSCKYLFLLLVLLMIMRSVQMGVGYLAVRSEIPVAIKNVESAAYSFYPNGLEMQIKNGKLSTNAYEPLAIDLPSQLGHLDTHLLVIDTQGFVEDYPAYHTLALATEKVLVYPDSKQRNTITPKLFYFSEITEPVTINRTVYDSLLRKMIPYADKLSGLIDVFVVGGLILLPFVGGFFSLFGYLACLLFLTAIVWIIASLCKRKYPFWTLYRMGMQGLTWPILLGFAFGLVHQPFAGMFFAVFIAWMIFVVLTLPKKTKE